MIGERAGVVTAWEMLCDRGLVHELAHMLHTEEDMRQRIGDGRYRYDPYVLDGLAHRIEQVERRVPGHHSIWAGPPALPKDPPPAPTFKRVELSPIGRPFLAAALDEAKTAALTKLGDDIARQLRGEFSASIEKLGKALASLPTVKVDGRGVATVQSVTVRSRLPARRGTGARAADPAR